MLSLMKNLAQFEWRVKANPNPTRPNGFGLGLGLIFDELGWVWVQYFG
jgi:hypothetical protein